MTLRSSTSTRVAAANEVRCPHSRTRSRDIVLSVLHQPCYHLIDLQQYEAEFKWRVQLNVQEMDPFSVCPEGATHSRGDFHATFTHFSSAEVPVEVIEWAIELTQKSIGHLYEQTWGWDAQKKFEELAHVRCW